ncbi:MAG TPA: branched-chain amino acid ABC transporter permease [Acidimicrobiales bacterium]|nr:branched-chain amino acid ABC transporter permease [Acidimicrobiales bacterium]
MSAFEFLIISLGTFGALNGILVLGLNLQFGTAGILNLSYFTAVAVSAYATGVAELHHAPGGLVQYIGGFGWPFLPSILFGMAVGAGFTFLLGSMAFLRLREDYLGLTLFAVQAGCLLVVTDYPPLFDGPRGLVGLSGPFQSTLSASGFQVEFLALTVVVLVAVLLVLQRIDRSPLGRIFRAVRDDETAAAAVGQDPWRRKTAAFVIGGATAGLGGALFATYVGGWDPGAWQTPETLVLLSALVVGGRGRPLGALLGSLFLIEGINEAGLWIPTIANRPDLLPSLQGIATAAALFAFLWWRPQGILPERRERVADFERRRRRLAPRRVRRTAGATEPGRLA